MLTSTRRSLIAGMAATLLPFPAHARRMLDVRTAGARGDGVALDSDAVNRAIVDLARQGGGTLVFPAGRYLCFSIRLASRITLLLSEGAVVEAADPARHAGRYDDPEERGPQLYQDFGHSHWHNSLFWGDGLEEVCITGAGRIDGAGLTRNGPGSRWRKQAGERPLSMRQMTDAEIARLEPDWQAMRGLGNKAIALRECRRVDLSGFTMRQCGHFALLLTGCENVGIDNLTIDTDRDGIDLDSVRRVRVTNCRVNTPNDDAIVVKSSYALGRAVPSEDVVIRDCQVSGWDLGTLLDGTRGTTQQLAPDRDRPTGRIKLGTESNGGYRNVLIERCRFDHCRGLALETVDGGAMENVTARNLVMRDVTTAPLFVRLGVRGRGPEGTGIGSVRGVRIADVDASGIDHRYPAALAGLAERPIADVTLSRVHLAYRGGGTAEDAARSPAGLADAYPEPSMFGVLPAWGLWTRHVRDLSLDRVTMETAGDVRPAIVTEDTVARASGTPLWPRRLDLDRSRP